MYTFSLKNGMFPTQNIRPRDGSNKFVFLTFGSFKPRYSVCVLWNLHTNMVIKWRKCTLFRCKIYMIKFQSRKSPLRDLATLYGKILMRFRNVAFVERQRLFCVHRKYTRICCDLLWCGKVSLVNSHNIFIHATHGYFNDLAILLLTWFNFNPSMDK